MSFLALLPLLAPVSVQPASGWEALLRQCREETQQEMRLACYDAIGRNLESIAVAPDTDEKAFQLSEDHAAGNLTLTRTVAPDTVLTVACVNEITHLRLRLAQPWQGERVVARIDGIPTSGNWFIREQGRLLEFGRGLPAIEELKRWMGQRELVLSEESGRSLRIDLSGLNDAVKPLRQRCRW
ncbi:type VI secretion system-associated protein [Brenneria alni]|uniref:Type VI secretion system-associated protein n=1 Tax=Brenneria alni TaxID=71656 RepID=A0A421DM84_9GAMM|nr:type VI secretion system-associated protein VasI [Brenneria alni]RLM21873.1 type VI secretion system-associated protein [Brenneria alni]